MKITKVIQGTPEWHQYRSEHFNASDAAAMLGISPYKTRSQLLKEYATGIVEEIDEATQARFDEGHRAEALARAHIERLLGIDLYPVVGSEGRLSASFDGRTLDGKLLYEHKSLNKTYRACRTQEDLPAHLCAQLEQQLMISGAERVLFHATKWLGDELQEEVQIEYLPNMKLRDQIVQGWTQFAIDMEAYKPQEAIEEKPEAKAVIELPALVLHAEGRLTNSNLGAFQAALAAHLEETRAMVYVTDQDFADAESRAKLYRETCKRIEITKAALLEQTVTIGEAFRVLDTCHEDLRVTALQIEKDVKSNTDLKKLNIINEGKLGYTAFIAELEKSIAPIRLVYQVPNFADAIKGKRLFSAMQDAVQTMLANSKAEASKTAAGIAANMTWLNSSYPEHLFLFNDLQTIVYKPNEDFRLLARTRVEDHQKVEAEKLEAVKQSAITEERARVEAAAIIDKQKVGAAASIATAKSTPDVAAVSNTPSLMEVLQAAAPAQIAAALSPPTLRLGQICERLGFTVTGDFVKSLGIEPAGKDKSAILFHERDFARICVALAKHIGSVYEQHKQAA